MALGGIALTAANYNARLRRYRAGEKQKLVVFRGDELLTLSIRLRAAAANTGYLVEDEAADEETRARRSAWLSG